MKRIVTILCAVMASMVILSAQEKVKTVKMYERGYRADIELSTAFTNQYEISTSHGFSFGNGLFVGGGVGFRADISPKYGVKPTFLIPVFADLKYSFLEKKCSPFVGVRVGEMLDITNSALKGSLNPYIGIDIARFSIKVGYEYQRSFIGTGTGISEHYGKLGVGFAF